MSLALWHWHIEISSKCTLRCPRCIRTEVPETLVNTELNLDFFKKHFTPDFITENVERITFCGDDGDPIYAHDLIPVIQYFKSIKPVSFTIVTNGSYKKTDWWIDLGKTLTEIDQIHFSIDGYDNDSNNIYRVNSDWDSILNGARVLRRISDCYMSWSSILFKFNEDHLDTMKDIARKIGFDVFQVTQSTKFGKYESIYPKDDPLQPSDGYLINHNVYEREITSLSNRKLYEPYVKTNIKHFENTKAIDEIFPLCHTGLKGSYIDARGYFYPCCWVANRYPHNDIWKSKRYDLKLHQLSDVVQLDYWKEKFIEGSTVCIHKCNKNHRYVSYNSREK
jgi:hypothetical protein